jgi:hypothetical protein
MVASVQALMVEENTGRAVKFQLIAPRSPSPSPPGYTRGMKERRRNRTLNRILAVGAITLICGLLCCLVPAGSDIGNEIFLGGLAVGYGAALVAVGRGLLDA